jgi:hypothetical protein
MVVSFDTQIELASNPEAKNGSFQDRSLSRKKIHRQSFPYPPDSE